MGIFKTLANELFGTNKEYEVKGLGVFTCKMCDWWRDEHYTWGGAVRLPIYSEDTFIILEGDALAPSPQQLEDLRTLLQDWKSMTAQLDRILPEESRLVDKEEMYASWQDYFYPEDISPIAQDSDGWEISFARTDDLPDYFYFIWKNNTVSDLTMSADA